MSFYHRYRWLLPLALFTPGLLAFRWILTGLPQFVFLLWNLLLAAFPLWMAHRMRTCASAPVAWLWAGLWLLFFPNALYIATDLFHLHARPGVPLWLDLMLLLSAAVNGALWGFLSLLDAEAWLRNRLQRHWVPVVVCTALLASGFGVYLGRYLRFNSWDVLAQPGDLLTAIAGHLRPPRQHAGAWALTIIFGTWSFLLYQAFKKQRQVPRNG